MMFSIDPHSALHVAPHPLQKTPRWGVVKGCRFRIVLIGRLENMRKGSCWRISRLSSVELCRFSITRTLPLISGIRLEVLLEEGCIRMIDSARNDPWRAAQPPLFPSEALPIGVTVQLQRQIQHQHEHTHTPHSSHPSRFAAPPHLSDTSPHILSCRRPSPRRTMFDERLWDREAPQMRPS